MKVLSIRQPWAWLIVNGWKPIENRSWATRYRGRFWVHASQGMTKAEYDDAFVFAFSVGMPQIEFPKRKALDHGAIIGSVELVDCVLQHRSRWFTGRWGFVLSDPALCAPRPIKGRLGFFEDTPP